MGKYSPGEHGLVHCEEELSLDRANEVVQVGRGTHLFTPLVDFVSLLEATRIQERERRATVPL